MIIPPIARAQPASPVVLGLSPRRRADRTKEEKEMRPEKTPAVEAGTLAMPVKKRM
jgi:hypothetical protein